MNKADQIEKVYYSISEVAEMFNLTTSQIRFWESEIELLKPRRNGSGLRRYTQDDIAVIRKVVKLIREDGFTLRGVNKQLASDHDSEYCAFCGRGRKDEPTGYVLNVDGIKAHVLMSNGDPVSYEMKEALGALVKAAASKFKTKEVSHG